MIDEIRWKFVASAAIIAMVVSMVSGGLNGIAFNVLIFRAMAGGVGFTVLAIGLNLLVVHFFPEILDSGDFDKADAVADAVVDNDEVGSRVNILTPVEDEEVSDGPPAENEAVAGTMIDGSQVEVPEELPPESASESLENLEDLDRFSGAFAQVDDDIKSGPSARSNSGPGADNDPQEIAQAIQTVMKRDKKG